jgi:hypothetical protein
MLKRSLSRTVIVLVSSLALTGCASSTQATRAMNVGGAMFGIGAVATLIGYSTSTDANLENNGGALLTVGGLVSGIGLWSLVIGAATRPGLRRIESLDRELQASRAASTVRSNTAPSLAAPAIAAPTISEPVLAFNERSGVNQPLDAGLMPITVQYIDADTEISPRLANELGYVVVSAACYGSGSSQLRIYGQSGNLVHAILADLELNNSSYFPIDATLAGILNEDGLLPSPSHRYEVCNRSIVLQ